MVANLAQSRRCFLSPLTAKHGHPKPVTKSHVEGLLRLSDAQYCSPFLRTSLAGEANNRNPPAVFFASDRPIDSCPSHLWSEYRVQRIGSRGGPLETVPRRMLVSAILTVALVPGASLPRRRYDIQKPLCYSSGNAISASSELVTSTCRSSSSPIPSSATCRSSSAISRAESSAPFGSE